VATPPIDAYRAAFLARCDAMERPGHRRLSEPAVHGVVSSSDGPPARLLVIDDRALDVVAGLLPDVSAGTITVLATAPRCTDLLSGRAAWKAKTTTAMVGRDLHLVPELPLPSGLTLRPVRRSPDDPADGVALRDAVAVAIRADPSEGDPDALERYLSALPSGMQLFAAVDGDDVVRATSGFGVFDRQASVVFVNTEPGSRRRGIGRAMTATALRAALAAGAQQACLDASDVARPIYRRLGFEVVDGATQFSRVGPATIRPTARP
jgi:GNAT superfamily N-acetyltransferase